MQDEDQDPKPKPVPAGKDQAGPAEEPLAKRFGHDANDSLTGGMRAALQRLGGA